MNKAKANFKFLLSDIGVNEPMIARDLYKHEDIGLISGEFLVDTLVGYGCVALRLRKPHH